jgi:membrane associated rhomboid family serine protease
MALILDSRGIPCCIDHSGSGWCLLVPQQRHDDALRELDLYERANRDWPPPLPVARQLVANTLPAISILILLATFYNLTLIGITSPDGGIVDFRGVGAAHAAQIRSGQWWQCITALTLHADLTHLLGNLTIGGVFIILLCREFGSGLAWTILLASGAGGNLINAWLQSPEHTSVGASTAVFGAVGILAATNAVQNRHNLRRRWSVPIASGLALLTILGTEGKHTDIGAHLFGFGSGVCVGMAVEYLVGKYGRPNAVINVLLALVSAVVVVAAWWCAREFGGSSG